MRVLWSVLTVLKMGHALVVFLTPFVIVVFMTVLSSQGANRKARHVKQWLGGGCDNMAGVWAGPGMWPREHTHCLSCRGPEVGAQADETWWHPSCRSGRGTLPGGMADLRAVRCVRLGSVLGCLGS